MCVNVCAECGIICEKKYCSKICNNRAWKKSKTFLKNECLICKKPCSNKYCSRECASLSLVREYKEICLNCGKEFTFHKIGYKKRGGMKYCSLKCSSSVYYFDEDFFLRSEDIQTRYEVMGFLFGNACISNYVVNHITINTNKEMLRKFVTSTKTTYPTKIVKIRGTKKRIYRLTFRNKSIMDYLYDIGFSHHLSKHTFPVILEEYKKFFIKGFLNSPNCCVFPKHDHDIVVLITKSYHIMRTIADLTNGNMMTKDLEYCCVFKDYDKFYRTFINSSVSESTK